MSLKPILRFAPSPNGRLHLGHAYSALLNAALAGRLGGRLLLRIEGLLPRSAARLEAVEWGGDVHVPHGDLAAAEHVAHGAHAHTCAVEGVEAGMSLWRTQLPARATVVAAALDAGQVGLAQLSDAYVRRPEVQQVFGKVRITTTDTVCPHEPTLAFSDRIVIRTNDGRTLDSGEVVGTRGDAATPLADSELEAKFMDCCAYGQFTDARGLFDTFKQLPRSTPWKT